MKIIPILAAAFSILTLAITVRADEPKPGKSPELTATQKSACENLLLENSKKLNRGLPVMTDADTRLDTRLDTTLAMGMQMHYKYTMVGVTSGNIDTKKFRQLMEANLIKIQCADKGAVILLKAGVDYFYSYSDKNGVLIASIRINKKICGIE